MQQIGAHGLGNIFKALWAEIGKLNFQPRLHLSIGVLRKTNSTGLGDTLQSRGDIDAIAHQVAVAFLDYIAKVDADPELDTPLRRQASIALDHAVLDLDGATNRVNDASELDEDAIACPLNDAAVMQSDSGINQIAAKRTQPRKRPLLVRAGQPAVSDDVRRKDGCELTILRHGFHHRTRD